MRIRQAGDPLRRRGLRQDLLLPGPAGRPGPADAPAEQHAGGRGGNDCHTVRLENSSHFHYFLDIYDNLFVRENGDAVDHSPQIHVGDGFKPQEALYFFFVPACQLFQFFA